MDGIKLILSSDVNSSTAFLMIDEDSKNKKFCQL